MAKKLKKALISLGLLLSLLIFVPAQTIAATCSSSTPSVDGSGQPLACDCPAGFDHPKDADGNTVVNQCDSIKKPIDCPSGRVLPTDNTKCAPLGNECNGLSNNACLKNNPITTYINDAINFLSAGVGIIVIGMIILGGIQYSMAGDNPTATQAAKQRITNGLIALFIFLFLFAFLQWLVPGGL